MLVREKVQQLRARIVLVDDRVADVGAVEAETNRRASASPRRDRISVAGLRVGGGGQGDAGNCG